MELRGLEYFVAVAEERSFTRAAQRCFVTQPTISAQINSLERELGEPLFDRGQRVVALTEGGELLLPYARRCLQAAHDAATEFSARAGLLRGELRIGTGGGVEHTTIPELLGRLHTTYPGIDIEVTESTSKPLLEMVVLGQLHAAVIAETDDGLPATISSAPMFGQRIVAVFDPTIFPLEGLEPLTLATIAEHPVITYPRTSALRGRIDASSAAAGVDLRVNYAANDVRLQLAFAQQGLGIALSVRSDPALKDCGLTIRDTAPEIDFQKILVWRNDIATTAPLRAFLQLWSEMTQQTARRS